MKFFDVTGEYLMSYEFPPTFQTLDFVGLACLFVFVLSTLAVAEILRRKDKVSGASTRKIVHLAVGNVVLVFPFVFSSVWIALIGPAFFIIFTYFTCPGSPIKKFKLKGVEEGHTYGTVFYAISLTALVAIFFRPNPSHQYNIILLGSFMPLVWGDGISAVVGSKFGNDKPYTVFGGTKTLLGSWSAAFATFGAVTISTLILQQTLSVAIYIGLFTGFITAIIEAITPKGFDNLAVPMINALGLFLLYRYFHNDLAELNSFLSLSSIITGLVVGLVLAVLGIIFKALTWDGGIAGFYFGIIILGLGSWSWGVMYFSFFLLGTLFTFIGSKRKKDVVQEFEKGDTARDSIQAMVNSIVPAFLAFVIVLARNPLITVMAAGAIAVSLGDTLGTEIGSLSVKKPRSSIKPWIKVDRGTPGAVSILGLTASVIGASVIGVLGYAVAKIDLLTSEVMPNPDWLLIIYAIIGGFIGAYLDSIFACTIQKMNKCNVCGKITEKSIHCQERTEYVSGKKWMHNDLVNLFSIIGGAIIALVCYLIGTLF